MLCRSYITYYYPSSSILGSCSPFEACDFTDFTHTLVTLLTHSEIALQSHSCESSMHFIQLMHNMYRLRYFRCAFYEISIVVELCSRPISWHGRRLLQPIILHREYFTYTTYTLMRGTIATTHLIIISIVYTSAWSWQNTLKPVLLNMHRIAMDPQQNSVASRLLISRSPMRGYAMLKKCIHDFRFAVSL